MNISIKKKVTSIIAAFVFAFSALALPVVVPAASVSAQSAPNCADDTYTIENGVNCAQGEGTPANLFNGEGSIFTTVVNVLLFIIGAICVIMLIWGGIRYTTSAGNSANVTAAKNTIMYAIIGLVIAFLAFAIVNWVLVSVGTAA